MSDENDALFDMFVRTPPKGAATALEVRKEQRAPKPIDGRRGRTRGVVKATVQLNVRMEQNDRDAIIDAARDDNRTIVEFLLTAVEAYVAAKGRTKQGA
jgi:hypothetical protein